MSINFKYVFPSWLLQYIREKNALRMWKKRGCLENAPQFIKENIFLKYGIKRAKWIETGTYLGTTTSFLEKNFGEVFSIEPSVELYNRALSIFKNRRIKLFNDFSEAVFPVLLPQLSGDINFWLDGHYSAGITAKGKKECPVEDELSAIENNLSRFENITILIDDVRCFLNFDLTYSDYPTLDYLVDWARKNRFNWCIEQDIFIMRKFH